MKTDEAISGARVFIIGNIFNEKDARDASWRIEKKEKKAAERAQSAGGRQNGEAPVLLLGLRLRRVSLLFRS